MTIATYIENEDGISHSIDKHGNVNLFSAEDVNLYPHMMPVSVPTKTKVKKISGYSIQVFGTELHARKNLVTVPSGIFFPDFNKEIKVPLVNYGNDVVRIKKGSVIAQFRVVQLVKVDIKQEVIE